MLAVRLAAVCGAVAVAGVTLAGCAPSQSAQRAEDVDAQTHYRVAGFTIDYLPAGYRPTRDRLQPGLGTAGGQTFAQPGHPHDGIEVAVSVGVSDTDRGPAGRPVDVDGHPGTRVAGPSRRGVFFTSNGGRVVVTGTAPMADILRVARSIRD